MLALDDFLLLFSLDFRLLLLLFRFGLKFSVLLAPEKFSTGKVGANS